MLGQQAEYRTETLWGASDQAIQDRSRARSTGTRLAPSGATQTHGRTMAIPASTVKDGPRYAERPRYREAVSGSWNTLGYCILPC